MYAHLQVYGDSLNTTLWRQAISIELSVPAAALVWPRSTTRTAHKKLRSPPRESRLREPLTRSRRGADGGMQCWVNGERITSSRFVELKDSDMVGV